MLFATIGYEGLNTAIFFDLLIKAGVEKIVDVRELPISHKHGFSKKALMSEAPLHGISYEHIGALGSPSEYRLKYRNDGDWIAFSKGYRDHLNSQRQAISKLCSLISGSYCCLLCFEANYLSCHRSILANRLRIELDGDLSIIHLSQVTREEFAWLRPGVDTPILQSTICAEVGAYFPLGIINPSD